ncbi:PTPA-CTERM sorting domain-containing protein [Nodosilinea sp. FACHB-13]|uniref:PTPA-CTERM sorting domain-containing protein n=1 Tax=Cyanophyceae TaxID=3028117 RepID=UPI0016838027|nr:PTPA-CTERM sorting domain-containing protein [Nodosilinea sp. FACHB-13]MBD2109848.1 PTPA-CTERM sorting domain-containing protein [Nodosilinea sp. FACHB-13]
MRNLLVFGAFAVSTAASFLISENPAQALGIACPVPIQSLVSPLDAKASTQNGCQIGIGNGGNDSLDAFNGQELFGKGDWKFAGKDENGALLENRIGVNFTPGASLSGNWDISDLFGGTVIPDDWTDIALVLKGSGRVPGVSGTNSFVAYLLSGVGPDGFSGTVDDWTGSWSSPFVNNNGRTQAVSHISLYYRNGGEPIPTPALLPGLVGLGVAALRKRKQEESESA